MYCHIALMSHDPLFFSATHPQIHSSSWFMDGIIVNIIELFTTSIPQFLSLQWIQTAEKNTNFRKQGPGISPQVQEDVKALRREALALRDERYEFLHSKASSLESGEKNQMNAMSISCPLELQSLWSKKCSPKKEVNEEWVGHFLFYSS